MKQSQLFPKTKKEAPKDAVAVNHKLLVRAGFMDQLMAGSWTLLPLGWRVISKINQIIREEMNATGAQELLMPLMHPKEIWNETGRWDSAAEVMYKLKDTREKEFALSFTHEEIVLDLVRKHLQSYSDLPVKVYHFSTKFRNESRATSGILRGREFLMKDLYSVHATEEDFKKYYEEVSDAYLKIFKRLGFKIIITEAAGGVFTKNLTREYQVIAPVGEDTIYVCNKCDAGFNKEIFKGEAGDKCPKCGQGTVNELSSIEVGNIFPFGTYYSEKMGIYFTDKTGSKKPVWFGSYGIGTTRVLGALVEVFHDDKGIIWPEAVAPFKVHLIQIENNPKVKKASEKLYNDLAEQGVEVLYDDREGKTAGEKFADADLIGIPLRVVVSERTLAENNIELKRRNENETSLIKISAAVKKLVK
ncbi:MAG: aminoacyl--tRNA ligase-related protein [bacterium]|nr:aminoacyl--tRNA ligase-related protein [bacterium]